MAKEEKVESKVEVKEKTVSVEMSPEQKQAFVEFMAKRDADEAEAKAKEAIKAENDRPAVVNTSTAIPTSRARLKPRPRSQGSSLHKTNSLGRTFLRPRTGAITSFRWR